jgi:hypothetical protein
LVIIENKRICKRRDERERKERKGRRGYASIILVVTRSGLGVLASIGKTSTCFAVPLYLLYFKKNFY